MSEVTEKKVIKLGLMNVSFGKWNDRGKLCVCTNENCGTTCQPKDGKCNCKKGECKLDDCLTCQYDKLDPDQLVIPEKTITVVFGYPLSEDIPYSFSNEGGFTRKLISEHIMRGYMEIYNGVDKSAASSLIKIGDLWLHSMFLNKDGRYELDVTSA